MGKRFVPLPGHARQLQEIAQAALCVAFGVLSLGMPFFCFIWTFSLSLWLVIAGFFKFDPVWIAAGYAAVKEVAWLTPPPRFCKPLARNLASIQYGTGGAILQWAGEDASGKLRPPTRRSIRCSVFLETPVCFVFRTVVSFFSFSGRHRHPC